MGALYDTQRFLLHTLASYVGTTYRPRIGAMSVFTIGGKRFEVGGALLMVRDLTALTSNEARITGRVR